MNQLIQSWRWYGPNDPVSLSDILQAGASGIVTALHQIPHGEVWPVNEIVERKKQIEDKGLSWVVTESVAVHEEIKTGGADREKYIDNYRQTLANLAACGIRTVCYNFMPVLDWTRTRLDYKMPNGSLALYYDWVDLAVFDLFLLRRRNAEEDYSAVTLRRAKERWNRYRPENLKILEQNILMGVPTEGSVSISRLLESIEVYKDIGKEGLRKNLVYFLESIGDVCKRFGIKMTLHPDDPPYSILGLPRIVSNKEDLEFILQAVDDDFNGLCFCTGSLGAGEDNDVVDILGSVKDRVYFAHLRNVRKDSEGNFFESDHLDGDVDMPAVMELLVETMHDRGFSIPMRPDHGHQMLDDLNKICNPGYSAIGRLRGLAELRGLEAGICRYRKR